MRLSGGPGDKLPNQYEGLWTVREVLRLLVGEFAAIEFEPLGEDGVEFVLHLHDGTRDWCQVKVGRTGESNWSLSALTAHRVLPQMRQRTTTGDRFCFVSEHATWLDELVGSVVPAPDQTTWMTHIVAASKKRLSKVKRLTDRWEVTAADLFQILHRIRIVCWDHRTLTETVVSIAAGLVDGGGRSAVDALLQLPVERVHRRVDAAEVWKFLADRKLHPARTQPRPAALRTLADLAQSFVTSTTETSIQVVHRAIENEIRAALTGAGPRITVVLGEAGSGKSFAIGRAVKQLKANAHVLALRLDGMQSSSIAGHLGLGDAPVRSLSRAAGDGIAYLVIDQLDAISLFSGRRTELFDQVRDLVLAATVAPNVRVLLASRKVDFDNDHRLRRLVQRAGECLSITVPRFTLSETEQALPDFELTEAQRQLLTTPVYCELFAGVANNEEGRPSELGSLYDHYWRTKQRLVDRTVGSQVFSEVVCKAANAMSDSCCLELDAWELDSDSDAVEALLSEGVLTRRGKGVAFFHETFFDYAQARCLRATRRSIHGLVTAGEQHLFRRAQVRQLLSFVRAQHGQNDNSYAQEVRQLLLSDDVRFHIKQTVIAWLGAHADPSPKEWAVVRTWRKRLPPRTQLLVRKAMAGSLSWFGLLDAEEQLATWLRTGSREDAWDSIWLLNDTVKKDRATLERAAELATLLMGRSEPWAIEYAERFVEHVGLADAGPVTQKLFEHLLSAGRFDERDHATLDSPYHMVSALTGSSPESACRLLGLALSRRLKVEGAAWLDRDEERNLPFVSLAQRAPHDFLAAALPVSLEAVHSYRRVSTSRDRFDSDPVFGLFHAGIVNSASDELLRGLQVSLQLLARDDPKAFEGWAAKLTATGVASTSYLLVRAYASAPETYAAVATDWLLHDPRLLNLDDLGRRSVAQLLSAVLPELPAAERDRVELHIVERESAWEKEHPEQHGLEALRILAAVDPASLGPVATSALAELKAQHRSYRPEREGFVGGQVVSPIPASDASEFTDEDWLVAMKTYASDEHSWDPAPNGGLKGSAVQLSRVLGDFGSSAPERFAHLLLRLPVDTHRAYPNALLHGLRDSDLPLDLVLALIDRFGRTGSDWVEVELVRLVGHACDNFDDDRLLDYVAWAAMNHPDPASDCEDLLTTAINSVRGEAVRKITSLVWNTSSLAQRFANAIASAVRDRSMAVRTVAADACVGLLTTDPDLALRRFTELCTGASDRLLASRTVERFLGYSLWNHFALLRPTIEHMLSATDETTVRAGARTAVLAGLFHEEAADLLEACITGSEPARLGAAERLAVQLAIPNHRSQCQAGLTVLFHDEAAEVRKATARCFANVRDLDISEVEGLGRAFVDSPAFGDGARFLVGALEESTGEVGQLVLTACRKLIDMAGDVLGHPGYHVSHEAKELADLVLSTYRTTEEPQMQSDCLDLLDELIAASVYSVAERADEVAR